LDHSWGRWVYEAGLGSSGCSLAAPYLGIDAVFSVTNERTLWPFHRIVRIPADTQPDDPYLFFLFVNAIDRFPYGQDVLPDVRL
jgi:hypothetical protein